jgi:hypothetical protein
VLQEIIGHGDTVRRGERAAKDKELSNLFTPAGTMQFLWAPYGALPPPFNCTMPPAGLTVSALVAIASVAVSNWFSAVACVGV